MKIKLDYGRNGLEIELPNKLSISVIARPHGPGFQDQGGAIRQALRAPFESPPLRELAKSGDRVGIVVNDITRATPYQLILPIMLEELQHVPEKQIIFFVATGIHRASTKEELRAMLGEQIAGRYRILQNDARDRASHRLAGKTKSGNPIWIHRDFLDCDVRILTGFIEPYFFAGFSGGGKAIMPGLALLETILNNHSPCNIDHPKATWGSRRVIPCGKKFRRARR